MISHDARGTRFYTFETFDPALVDHAFFTRLGGHSQGPYASLNLGGTNGDNPQDVLANHELLFEVFGRPYESRFDVWQVHGTHIRFGDQPRPREQKHQPADGIFTDNPEVTLVMRFADCVPIMFHDPIRGVVGIAHGGWQGTLHGIGAEAVRAAVMRSGCQPKDLRVGLGPSICGQCYQVGQDVFNQFTTKWGQAAEQFFSNQSGALYLDLWAANEWALRQAGIEMIEQSGICTATNLHEWYSYRFEKGFTGRFAAVIALKRG